MPRLSFTPDEIKRYIKADAKGYFHKEAVEIAEEMAVHADGKFPEKLLYERRPNEPDEVLEYRKKIFSAKTKPVFSKVFSSLQKIRRSSDWSIRFSGDFKIPHMGWNKLSFLQADSPLFAGLDEGHVYFVHSFHAKVELESDLLAVTDYHGPVTAIVGRGNVFGMQFHPEKSGELGMALLGNFLALTRSEKTQGAATV